MTNETHISIETDMDMSKKTEMEIDLFNNDEQLSMDNDHSEEYEVLIKNNETLIKELLQNRKNDVNNNNHFMVNILSIELAIYQKSVKIIMKDGIMIHCDKNGIQKHPCLDVMQKAFKNIIILAEGFGLTTKSLDKFNFKYDISRKNS